MKTCKDCIHFEVCDSGRHIGEYIEDDGVYSEGVEKECVAFRDKAKFIELPLPVNKVKLSKVLITTLVIILRLAVVFGVWVAILGVYTGFAHSITLSGKELSITFLLSCFISKALIGVLFKAVKKQLKGDENNV